MFGNNFEANQYQDNSAGYLRLVAKALAKLFAELDSEQSHGGRHNADYHAGYDNFLAEEAKAESHRKGVDTRRDGKANERNATGNVFCYRVAFMQSAGFDHLEADEAKNGKSDPMVEIGYVVHKAAPKRPTNDRHKELEQSEMERKAKPLAAGRSAEKCSRAHRNSKGIERKRECNEYNINNRQ